MGDSLKSGVKDPSFGDFMVNSITITLYFPYLMFHPLIDGNDYVNVVGSKRII
jgi:hypothetical protein